MTDQLTTDRAEEMIRTVQREIDRFTANGWSLDGPADVVGQLLRVREDVDAALALLASRNPA